MKIKISLYPSFGPNFLTPQMKPLDFMKLTIAFAISIDTASDLFSS